MVEQGISREDINASVQKCAPSGECDCERIAIAVGIVIGAITLAVVAAARNRAAAAAARAAIEKAMRTSKQAARELEEADDELGTIELESAEQESLMNRTLDVLEELEQTAFTGSPATVTLIENLKP